ncbi:hypothetical protein E4T47_05944 [Aureobasidium subglaciale]|nr:hypothetical protein E4T47_05944 [Aureobasidium subglaciale]
MEAVTHKEQAAHDSVDRHLDDGKTGRQGLLSHVRQISRSKGGKVDFGIGEVKLQAFGAIFAGADTTAIALRSVFYHLLKSPNTLVDLRTELDTAIREGRLSDPPRFAEASNLPSLTATIKEAMRLQLSLGLTMTRIIADTGIHVVDRFVPTG